MKQFEVAGHLVDIPGRRTFPAVVTVTGDRITKIAPADGAVPQQFILPGFIDAHVHVESSMLVPSEFARLAVCHGTVATISDPHEIANVLGVKGVEYMLDNAAQVSFKCCFGAPSCVPATVFETAGAAIDATDVNMLLQRNDIYYLSEMMNYPGVLQQDAEVMAKIAAAKRLNKPVDGHAPGLRGADAAAYIHAGISTDHECFTLEEALDKLQHGMHILIREGSAARNFEALASLLQSHPQMVMFCSDDKHPDNLVEGHINILVKRALAKGYDLYNILQAACINPVKHYNMPVGLLREDDPADFIVVNNLDDMTVLQTFINGQMVAENGVTKISSVPILPVNQFNCDPVTAAALRMESSEPEVTVKVIEALEGQLITNMLTATLQVKDGAVAADTETDTLKIVVVNRYHNASPALGFIRHFGLQKGAIASTVAHDSHNIIAVGVDDESICEAINQLVKSKGGICVTDGKNSSVLALPVAGLMSAEDGYATASAYSKLDAAAKALGSKLDAPFMTLSFMALLVIPHLKLSDKGLFNGDTFTFTSTFA